ncbi:MAG: hypothetical protein HC877_23030 [Thioploca sp.]|nr:hypothetical protein [Thioploca sp.]
MESPLEQLFDQVTILQYAHWESNEELIDLTNESRRIPDRDIILAKSAGVILALKAISEK